MTGKIFFKLIGAVLGLLVVALVAVDFFASKVAESTYLETLERELIDKGKMLAIGIGSGVVLAALVAHYVGGVFGGTTGTIPDIGPTETIIPPLRR